MKRRILKKFVKAYRPYGISREGIILGIKEEGKKAIGAVVLESGGGRTIVIGNGSF